MPPCWVRDDRSREAGVGVSMTKSSEAGVRFDVKITLDGVVSRVKHIQKLESTSATFRWLVIWFGSSRRAQEKSPEAWVGVRDTYSSEARVGVAEKDIQNQ